LHLNFLYFDRIHHHYSLDLSFDLKYPIYLNLPLDLSLEFLEGSSGGGLSSENLELSESEVRLVLEEVLLVIVNESETSSLATTELGVESVDNNVSSINLELLGELLSDLFLGDGGSIWVKDINSHLSSGEQRVSEDLLGSNNDCHFSMFLFLFFLVFP